jgi:hypothetical protein
MLCRYTPTIDGLYDCLPFIRPEPRCPDARVVDVEDGNREGLEFGRGMSG